MDSLAEFHESSYRDNLAEVAEESHHDDLRLSDLHALGSAARQMATHMEFGALVGLGFGVWMAYRLWGAPKAILRVFPARKKPTRAMFADGRSESIPDIKPTFGVVATYLFLSTAGLAIGGNIGAFTGHYSARRLLMRDPESMGRLKKTFRNLEKIGGVPEAMGRIKMALRKVEQDVAKKKQDVEKMERDLEKMGRNREATGRIEKAFRNAKEREELAGWWEERVE